MKSGLFGWKMITVKPAVAETSHTSIRISNKLGLSSQSKVKKISNNTTFEKWGLTAGGDGLGERGQCSELPVKQDLDN